MKALLTIGCLVIAVSAVALSGEVVPQGKKTWTKRSPLKETPPSPGLSYETSIAYDPVARRVIRWGGHAQGGVKGSGEQIAELWTLDPATMTWEHKEPNRSPPATCCAQQNVFDLLQNRFLRFKGAGGNHGWQWFREIYLNNSSVWNYDLASNTWRDLAPVPEPSVGIMRCASWDSDYQVAVVFGGEGRREGTVVFDPYTNTWTRMQPKNEPPLGSREPRSGGNMTYDAARKLHVLFGSQFSDDPHTWAYSLQKNEWYDQKPATQPPTNRNDPVLAYDSLNKVVVAVVRAADQFDGKQVVKSHLETWAYDAGKNTWQHLAVKRQPDCAGGRSRVMTFVPDQNFFLIDGYVKPMERVPGVEREHQIWTYRYAEAPPRAGTLPPGELKLTTTVDGANLQWTRSPSAEGYVIYRGEGMVPWQANLEKVARVAKTVTNYRDTGLKSDKIYHYVVRTLDADGNESEAGARVRTQPRIVEDAVAAVISAKEVALSWEPPAGFSDITGYHIERAPVEVLSEDQIVRLKKDTPPLPDPSVGAVRHIGKFERLTEKPVKETRFVDRAVDLAGRPAHVEKPLLTRNFAASQLDAEGKPYRYAVYAYRIRAVNALGVESGPSPYLLTIPSAPQHVFSHEDGDSCQLKWAANPEQGIKGYRVYWMKGPRPEGPGQAVHRLTSDPVAATRFTAANAGREPRRFWIV
ncbi:MAG: hypothetical protein AB7K24_25230, partial [Gemmataceae bacterium]